MSVLRLVIAWLVMAALPLQGIAAASMLFCEKAAHATVTQPSGHGHASHDHASLGHDHGHGGSGKADQSAELAAQPAEGSQGSAGVVDGGHACPICASCCNLVALTEAPILSFAGDAPQSPPLQEAVRVATRHAPTPDKPPRV